MRARAPAPLRSAPAATAGVAIGAVPALPGRRRAAGRDGDARRRGLRDAGACDQPPAIISSPAIANPEMEARGRGVCCGGADRRRLGRGEIGGDRHRQRLRLRVGDVGGAAGRQRRIGERGVERGPELGRDHRTEDSDREQPGDPGDPLLTPEAIPARRLGDRVEDGRGQRRDDRREAEAEDQDGRQDVGDVAGVGVDPAASAAGRSGDDRPAVIGRRGPVPEVIRPNGARGRRGSAEIGVVARSASTGV